MSNENELLEPLATEAGQQAIVRAIRDISSLEYSVRAEQAASQASAKAGEASQSASEASEAESKAKDWATKTDTYVEQQIITIPPAQEGEEPTTETINLYSAKYYAALAQDIFNNMSFDSVPIENSNNMVSSGTVYSALDLKADKSDTYTKTEVDTALSNVQSTLTFDNVPTANSDNPVKSSGIKTALDSKQDTLTFDSTPTANSTNPVTSGGIYTALQNVNIDIDDEITEDSDNPVTSAAIYEALQNFTPSGGGDTYNGDVFVSGTYIDTNNLIDNLYDFPSSWISTTGNLVDYTATQDCYVCGFASSSNNNSFGMNNGSGIYINNVFVSSIQHTSSNHSAATPIYISLKKGDNFRIYNFNGSVKLDIKVYGVKHGDVVSEQMYSNVLYENSSGASGGTTITLNDDWSNYDFIEFYLQQSSNSYGRNTTFTSKDYLQNIKDLNGYITFFTYDTYTTKFHIGENYNKIVIDTASAECKIYKIVGYKMAKGGYSGIVSDARMTVKSGSYEFTGATGTGLKEIHITFDSPMPDTNYIVLTSPATTCNNYTRVFPHIKQEEKTASGFTLGLYCDSSAGSSNDPYKINWIAIRPNSYTREGMVEDVLFSNASGVNSGTINLSGNISDYDLIAFQVWTGQETYACGNPIIQTSTLLEFKDKGGTYRVGADRAGLGVVCINVISDNQFNLIENTNNAKIYKITGIKFGRYVSGVAVDTTVTQNSNAVVTSGAVYDALQNIPSGGGSGGSITIDSVPTENSQNAVSSGGVYDAIQNINVTPFSDTFFLSAHSLTPSFAVGTNGTGYYTYTANELLAIGRGSYVTYNYYKDNSSPAIASIALVGNTRYLILISLFESGVIAYGSRYGTRNSSLGQILDTENNVSWYYSGLAFNSSDYSQNESVAPLLSDTYLSVLDAATALLSAADPTVTDNPIRQELFSPDNTTITSGSTIPNTTSGDALKTLITYSRPIQINGETYYFVKLDNNTYYYENPNNTITIDSSWVITITAKSSGGSSITVDSTITQGGTNPVEGGAIYTALDDKADQSTTYTKTEVDTALASKGDVTTNTDQNITGTKTFVGSKKVGFKQSTANDKLGFTLYGNTGTERGYLEFNPTNTVDGVTGLMTLGNYATSAAALTQVGFRRYSNISGASGAYNLLMPMVADARTPFSLTTTYQNFYLPLGFTDGTTTVKTAKSGLVDLSPLLASLEARIAALEGN